MEKAIPEQRPLHATFASIQAALDFRANHGGWIFVRDDAAGGIWFDPQFTARGVMLHPVTKGSGKLI